MAKYRKKRSYNRRKSNGDFSKFKRIATISIWGILMIGILLLVGRYFVTSHNDAQDNTINGNPLSLQEVSLAPGMEIEKHSYTGYNVYFNSQYHIPNCVSYEITRMETTGEVPRCKNFEPDPNFKATAYPSDYIGSGYDRGHMAPAGDMKWSMEAMKESFYMSNICPQNKILNTGAWHKLEKRIREWANRDGSLIVVCGPILTPDMETIGKTKVAVPEKFFKVILAPNVKSPRAIGFIYKNDRCIGDMKDYAVSVDSVESLTGYDFFFNLPDEIENVIEAKCNFNEWNVR